jgi:hypothetical protein
MGIESGTGLVAVPLLPPLTCRSAFAQVSSSGTAELLPD